MIEGIIKATIKKSENQKIKKLEDFEIV